MTDDLVFLQLSQEGYSFITKFDPDRDRTATRQDMVDVLHTIQDIVTLGRVG